MTLATPRAPAVDALRCVALLGIIAVNAPYFAQPLGAPPPAAGAADPAALWAIESFATGRFFPIFSFLFGFGLSVLFAREAEAPAAARRRVPRRLAGLSAFGALNAALLFFGDILMLYALLGAGLRLCRGLSARTLLILAAGFFALGLPTQTAAVAALIGTFAPVPPPVPGEGPLGGYLETVRHRLAVLPEALPFVLAFNGPVAAAMIFAGSALGRLGLFPPAPELAARLRRPARLALLVGALGSGAATAAFGLLLPDPGAALPAAGLACLLALGLLAPVLAFGLCTLLLARFASAPRSPRVRVLATAGGSSLSGHLLHALLLGAVFHGWGLGLHGALGPAAVLGVSVATWAAIVAGLALWSRAFRLGPAEWVLRWWIDGARPPLLRAAPVSSGAGNP